ncbi:hypothetical protein ABPG74_004014 [Tetrahymena malaccensis]
MFTFKPKKFFCMMLGEAFHTLRLKKDSHWLDVKDSYQYLLKKYHPDINQNTAENVEMIKKLNIAYKILDQYYANNNLKTDQKQDQYDPNMSYSKTINWKSRTEKELYNEIYQHYFGTLEKDAISNPSNSVKRVLFEGEYQRALRSLLGQTQGSFMDEEFWKYQQYEGSGDFYFKNQYTSQSNQSESFSQTLQNMNPLYRYSLGAFSLIVFGMGSYVLMSENQDPFKGKLNNDKIESIRQKALDYRVSEKQKLIDEAFQSQNPMKSWPVGQKSSNSMDQLIDYTIYGDLKFYFIESGYFYKDIDEMTFMDHKEITKKPLTCIRQNHMVSLSLEAERCLQNIFIKAEDLKRIIREKGYFECPGIFMRYKGFVYFRHRAKPIVLNDLENIPNNQTLSLFEIFHRYYSPIPEVFDEYYEYRLSHGGYIEDTTTLENSSWIGNVTFNHRNINKLLIKGDEKNIFMWRGKSPDDPQEARYIKVWDTIYNPPDAPIGQEAPKKATA